MFDPSSLPEGVRLRGHSRLDESPADRALKDFRYVVSSVNDQALKVWADLWRELREEVTPSGVVLPKPREGFKPSCGRAEFLEKFWLLKHYLDYVHRLCKKST